MADYLLAYEAAAAVFMQPQLHSFVKQHKLIAQWSQPFAGLYFLKSDADLRTLALSFDEFFARGVLHVVCPIVPETTGGILPMHVWDWLAAPPTPGLSGILGLLERYGEEDKRD